MTNKETIVARAAVHAGDDVLEVFHQVMQSAGIEKAIPMGSDVLVKVNISWDFFLPGTNCSPWAVEAVARELRPRCRKLYLAEGDQVLVSAKKAARLVDMERICREYDCEWVNISILPASKKEMTPPSPIGPITLPDLLASVLVVDLAAMKTHFRSTITGALKNLYGFLDKDKHNYHDDLDAVIADLAGYIKPVFSIIDGTIGLEGNGPKSGTTRIANLVLASTDPVALDSEMARLMGFDPRQISHLVECEKRGLGIMGPDAITFIGEAQPVDPPFTPARKNIVAVIESALRPRWLRGTIFDSILLFFSRRGAQFWYLIWYYLLSGHKMRDGILDNQQYGKQWAYWRKKK